MNCRIGRDKECGIAGCAFKRAGATSCADFKEQPIIPKLTAKKEKKIRLKAKQYSCFYCGKPLRERQVTKDHVIAKSLGGTSHSKNLVDSCKLCNTFKSNMTVEQFTFKLQIMLNNLNKLKEC